MSECYAISNCYCYFMLPSPFAQMLLLRFFHAFAFSVLCPLRRHTSRVSRRRKCQRHGKFAAEDLFWAQRRPLVKSKFGGDSQINEDRTEGKAAAKDCVVKEGKGKKRNDPMLFIHSSPGGRGEDDEKRFLLGKGGKWGKWRFFHPHPHRPLLIFFIHCLRPSTVVALPPSLPPFPSLPPSFPLPFLRSSVSPSFLLLTHHRPMLRPTKMAWGWPSPQWRDI